MKHRWGGWPRPIMIASLVALAGCAPSQTGGEHSASPESAPVQTTPSADAEEPSAAPADTPGSSDYDY